MNELTQVWTYLAEEPLLWLTATLIAYSIGDAAFRASGKRAYVNPVLIAVTLLAIVLWKTATPYQTYFEGAQFVHFMLGPATVALAAPLYGNLTRIRKSAIPLICALVAGSVTAIFSALGVAYALGIRGETLVSIAPKSVTAPVALGISESMGGSPTLTAVLVIITGVMGAVMATPLLNLLGVTDWRARGFSVGVASHGIGTARAFQVNETAGAFAGIGMGLNALLTTLLAPLIVTLFT
ncbi:LrgB family protein [Granulosicoccus antarcticus]|uniref:Inner membrane protein YohK n=1 Tax=Granulosicoccus antarcticus IMCC3135 TaxID=1192854 RepID=A0A2Z2NJE8_9GAMM|nr:LrgB family protein [Granulosicoccus antarcticus]ASJ71223.1 Inner membrane protein YohK [Granulosicoccus antarcticus IMCC3135]